MNKIIGYHVERFDYHDTQWDNTEFYILDHWVRTAVQGPIQNLAFRTNAVVLDCYKWPIPFHIFWQLHIFRLNRRAKNDYLMSLYDHLHLIVSSPRFTCILRRWGCHRWQCLWSKARGGQRCSCASSRTWTWKGWTLKCGRNCKENIESG